MERLTTQFNGGYLFNIPHDLKQQEEYIDKVSIKLGQYEDAEEQGLLLRLEYPNGWIPVDEGLPPCSDDLLLIQCSGKPRANITLIHALCLASYTEEGWILELYPDWDGAEVEVWQYLPEPYKS